MYRSLVSVAEWQTDVCPVQGTRQALRMGRVWEGFCPNFSWVSNYVIHDLVSDIRAGLFFYHMMNRYQKQGAINIISKIIVC